MSEEVAGTVALDAEEQLCNANECDQILEENDEEEEEPKLHDLEAGDHIVRWTHIALYPVQVHGIVLSAGPDIVTLVDFGVASQSKSSADKKVGPASEDNGDAEAAAATDREAREVTKAAGGGDRRLEIITIADEKDIRRWKKVNYGAKVPGESRLKRLMSSIIPGGGGGGKAKAEKVATASEKEEGDADIGSGVEEGKAKEAKMEMPDSDPKGIVLARVRYLLENESIDEKGRHCNSVLPPYHIFNANSECIAVWVKTGRFSTLQAAIFLHSTALGQVKSAATLSLFVASQTVPVTTTVSAGGVLGWFGMTTTSTAMVSYGGIVGSSFVVVGFTLPRSQNLTISLHLLCNFLCCGAPGTNAQRISLAHTSAGGIWLDSCWHTIFDSNESQRQMGGIHHETERWILGRVGWS